MSETIQVKEIKQVWIAWTNTDLTEGRGCEFPLAICIAKVTALRLGARGSVQGCDCRVSEETIYRITNEWYGPVQIEFPTQADIDSEKLRLAREAVMAKVRAAGLTPEELKLIE